MDCAVQHNGGVGMVVRVRCVCVIYLLPGFVRAGSPANLNFKWVGDGGHDFS